MPDADPVYYVTPDAKRIADELIALLDQADPADWDRLTRRVRRTRAIASPPWPHPGWRERPRDAARFGAAEHLEAGWAS